MAALELKGRARSRRAVLQALGASTLAACAPRARVRRIEGRIIGGNHAFGHRVREGRKPTATSVEDVDVAILGGGIAGLSAAWAFDRAGVRDYRVLELEDTAGGTARSGTGPITPYPWAAHYVPVPSPANRPLVALLEEVGAVAGRDPTGKPVWAEEVLCREPQERLFFGGQWHEGLYPREGASPEDLRQLTSFEENMRHWARWHDPKGTRAFRVPRSYGSAAPEIQALDSQSMAQYMDAHGWTSPRLRWLVEYGCRDDFGSTLAHTSAWAGIHYFTARFDEEKDDSAEFLTWPEGNGRLVARLARLAGERVRLGALVVAVRNTQDRVAVVYEDAAGRVAGLRARHVVFALPRFLVPYLVADYGGSPPAGLRETVYGSWMVANLTMRDRPAYRGFPLAWDNVLYDSPSLGYVVATHQSGRGAGRRR